MPRSFARKMAILGGASFITYLEDAYPGTIIYDGQAPDGATVQSAYNRDVGALPDSSTFAAPGDNPLDADATGATPAQTFSPPQIPYGWSFINDDYLDIYSPELNSVFDGSEGSIGVFVKVPAAAWVDGQRRSIIYLQTDSGTNIINFELPTANNIFQTAYIAGAGTTEFFNYSTSSTSLLFMMMTWKKSIDNVSHYAQGALTGTDSGLAVWVGDLLSTNVVIGARSTAASQPYSGLISLVLINPTRAMTPAEIADISQRGGTS